MKSTDQDVLQDAVVWLEQGQRVTLFTVARTWGSSPRPPGALLAISADGRLSGSVSGGCVEDDLLQRLGNGSLSAETPTLVDYGVDRQEAARVGLPCGGRLEVLVEGLDSASAIHPLLEALQARRLMTRRVCLSTGESSLHPPNREEDFLYDGDTLQKTFGPMWRMLIIGAGQLSRYVAQFALTLDYDLTVCDPREEYARSWQLPGARLDTRMPDDAVVELAQDRRCVVLALSHDPKLDDMALLQALEADNFYVGALGSRANNEKRRSRLAGLGIAPDRLERLHGPVGLPVGSRSPPEIALAILAELTAARHGVRLIRDEGGAAVAATPEARA
ncbi:MAG: XdhC family protein [Gammaproteobacteria bacterium]